MCIGGMRVKRRALLRWHDLILPALRDDDIDYGAYSIAKFDPSETQNISKSSSQPPVSSYLTQHAFSKTTNEVHRD